MSLDPHALDPHDRCSFCGRTREQVGRLVAGGGQAHSGVMICNNCAHLVVDSDGGERLSHLDEKGAARMVDVGGKPDTERRAVARAELHLAPATVKLVRDGRVPKGDVIATARIAGIQAAKKTSELIPMAHPLPITHAGVELRVHDEGISIEATVSTTGKTGVEMEALTAATVAALTLYDMLKAVERGAHITDVRLVEKSGGRSGDLKLE